MRLYDVLCFLKENKITETDNGDAMRKLLMIDINSRDDVVQSSKLFKNWAFDIMDKYEDAIMNMDENTQVWFRDIELSKILDVSVNTIKNWRSSGALKFNQEYKNGKVEICRKDIDDFILKHSKYKFKWDNFKRLKGLKNK